MCLSLRVTGREPAESDLTLAWFHRPSYSSGEPNAPRVTASRRNEPGVTRSDGERATATFAYFCRFLQRVEDRCEVADLMK